MNNRHWAAPLIGAPWRPACAGPDAFDCWGLVRYVFKVRHGIDMPAVRVDRSDLDNAAALKRASQVSGWRLAASPPQADDIVLVRGPFGRRHVGLMIDLNGRLRVLHAAGYLASPDRAVGCVECASLAEVLDHGYSNPEFWRRSA